MERLFESTSSPYCKNGEGWSDGTQGSGSGRAQKRERPGSSRGGSQANRMPRVPRKALGFTNGGYGGGTPRRQGQPVERNRASGPGKVDSEGVKVYGFGRGGEGMASQTDQFIDGMFSGRVTPKMDMQ